eukprot:scaffold388931_cov16-Prasinocladus_malaysianus.AAC.1
MKKRREKEKFTFFAKYREDYDPVEDGVIKHIVPFSQESDTMAGWCQPAPEAICRNCQLPCIM